MGLSALTSKYNYLVSKEHEISSSSLIPSFNYLSLSLPRVANPFIPICYYCYFVLGAFDSKTYNLMHCIAEMRRAEIYVLF